MQPPCSRHTRYSALFYLALACSLSPLFLPSPLSFCALSPCRPVALSLCRFAIILFLCSVSFYVSLPLLPLFPNLLSPLPLKGVCLPRSAQNACIFKNFFKEILSNILEQSFFYHIHHVFLSFYQFSDTKKVNNTNDTAVVSDDVSPKAFCSDHYCSKVDYLK